MADSPSPASSSRFILVSPAAAATEEIHAVSTVDKMVSPAAAAEEIDAVSTVDKTISLNLNLHLGQHSPATAAKEIHPVSAVDKTVSLNLNLPVAAAEAEEIHAVSTADNNVSLNLHLGQHSPAAAGEEIHAVSTVDKNVTLNQHLGELSPAAAAKEILEVSTVDKRKNYRCVDRNDEPGFRFIPTDEELIQHYLMKKLEGQPIMLEGIHEVDLYQFNPEDLAENHPHLGELKWYFFTPRDRKYRKGLVPNRSAGNGYWKATGRDKKITLDANTPNERIIGYRKVLVFYHGNPSNGNKTNWIMHEFRPNTAPRVGDNLDGMRLDDVVLCKIYERPERKKKKCLKDQTSNQNEEQGMDVHASTSTPEIGNEDEPNQKNELGTS